MSHPVSAAVRVAAAVDLPDWARRAVNLADARLGARAWAPATNFCPAGAHAQPGAGSVCARQYDAHGKWMDGGETRRRRGPGHDWSIII